MSGGQRTVECWDLITSSEKERERDRCVGQRGTPALLLLQIQVEKQVRKSSSDSSKRLSVLLDVTARAMRRV